MQGAPRPTPETFQCATVQVPLDYRRPDGPTMDLAISRIKGTSPGKRRVVLCANPGGPGGIGLGMPMQLSEELPQEVLDRYDLIGSTREGSAGPTPSPAG
ncbi:hypothetical protein ACFQ78_33485 [Streptomyces sp. NPDC056519]|uniref:hypothetical protein n=1 Tax=Streptomyces sp. NPDC056519 TaxID=3345849 RepID=UPI0036C7CF5F